MRVRVLVLAAGLTVAISCGGGGHGAATTPQVTVVPEYQLLTHCGIHYTRFDNEWYYADPPNPQGHWPNPIDEGTLTVVDSETIVFTDPAGNRAVFKKHPPYPTPTIAMCA